MNLKRIVKEMTMSWNLVNKLSNKETKERVLASRYLQKLSVITIRKKLLKLVSFKKMI